MKREVFNIELNYIVDEDVRESLAILIDKIPDYFFNIPAASTGKYHPAFAQGDAGLVRHTKAAVRMAYELFGIYKFPQLFLYGSRCRPGSRSGRGAECQGRSGDHPDVLYPAACGAVCCIVCLCQKRPVQYFCHGAAAGLCQTHSDSI